MHRGIPFLAVCVGVLLLTGFAAGVVSSPEPVSIDPPVVPRSTGSSPKVHLAEVLTGTWCPPCGTADPALGRLVDEWHDNLIVLAWHCCAASGGTFDPWWDPAVLGPRNSFYGWAYLPTVVLDGGGTYGNNNPLFVIGAPSPTSAAYNRYLTTLKNSLDSSSNVVLDIAADLRPGEVVATVTVTATDPVMEPNLYLRTVVYEDALYYTQANGVPFHRNVVRALNEQPFAIMTGQSVTLTATFSVGPTWAKNKLGVAAFVQSGTKRAITMSGYPETFYVADVLNAAKVNLVPRGIIVQNDRGTQADYTHTYEVLLAQRGEHFDSWNAYADGVDTGTFDSRGLPDAAALAENPLVMWYTGDTRTDVISTAERDLLASHLDGGGSLLLMGSNISFDAWINYRAWFQGYLHAQYNGDDEGVSTATGVAGDPVSGAYAGVNLQIRPGGSPDRVDVMMPGPNFGVPFVYSNGNPGSVRAQHDADSRVLLLGFQYFEYTDARRLSVLGDIVTWMDGAAPPKVTVIQPNGGEQLRTGTTYDIKWTAHDVRIPADAIDIYFSSDGGGTWELVAAGEPNDGMYRWTVPDRNSASCRIKVVARDGSTTSPDGEAVSAQNFICGEPFFRINFGPGDVGWRLVSFPVILQDTDVPSVLATIAGNYRVVRTYDASSPADPWKAYVPTQAWNDLRRLDNTMAFWIEITGPATLDLMGDRPTADTPIALKAGWNLVGFPSSRTDFTVAMLKSATGATRVEGFNPAATPYFLAVLPDAYALRAGEGYWIYVPSDVVWVVPF